MTFYLFLGNLNHAASDQEKFALTVLPGLIPVQDLPPK